MKSPYHNFPALIRSLAILQPEDQITCGKMMAILGLSKIASPGLARSSKQSTSQTRDQIENTVRQTPEGATAPIQNPARKEKRRKPIPSNLTKLDVPESQPPDWLSKVNQLANPSATRRNIKVPLEPLLRPDWTRHILSRALATWSAQGPINLHLLVETIAQGKQIVSLPRLRQPSLSHGIQVLIDLGPAMEPFYMDQTFLEQQILKVIGTDRTQVFLFSGLPEWGIKEAVVEDWTIYKTPSAGTPVLLLTDLGIGGTPLGADRVGPTDWIRFSEKLARNENSIIALVPYTLKRIPTNLKKVMKVISWDRTTTVLSLKRSFNC